MVGVVSWESKKTLAGGDIPLADAPQAMALRASNALTETSGALRNFVNCRAWGSRERCAAPVRASLERQASN